jgi:hypothetical protein
MSSRSPRTTVSRLRREDGGNILISTVLVSMLVGALASLALTTGRQADWSSASDRNHELALGVSEAGIHDVISTLEAQATGTYTGSPTCNYLEMTPGQSNATWPDSCKQVTTPQGTYRLAVTRTSNGYRVDSDGVTGDQALKRGRRVEVSLVPPLLAPEGGGPYALFSKTSIELKNNDKIYSGDVFANDSVFVEQNAILEGSITSAKSWIQTQSGSNVQGNVWSGGYNPAGVWAMDIAGAVTGWAKASVTAPSDPETCGGETHSNYNVQLGSVTGNVTTLGQVVGGTAGSTTQNTCTPAAPAQNLPEFNEALYPLTVPAFASVAEFNTWRTSNPSVGEGTYKINEPNPSQTNRVDLSGWHISGDLVIITNAPVFTNDIDDAGLAPDEKATFIVVSHYAPPTSTGCDVNHDNSDCAIHAKNHFNESCNTAALLFADQGPVAVKNNSAFCGAIYSEGILIKNNQELNYDSRFDRTTGFGSVTWEIGRWQELKPS